MPALAGDHVRVLVDGYELTADTQRIALMDARDMHDVTTFGDAVHKFIPGQTIHRLEHSGFMDAGAGHSHPVLRGSAIDGVLSILLGQNAAPAVGDLMYSVDVLQNAYNTLPEAGKYVPFIGRYASKGASGGIWGVALGIAASFTNTSNGTTVDNGAATGNGGVCTLHVLQAAASDTYSISIEGSTTGAFAGEQTTLLTFPLNASVLDSERVNVAGTVPRYLRWRAVRTGSASNPVKIAVGFARL